MVDKLVESLQSRNPAKIKKSIKERLINILMKKIDEQKKNMAKDILKEAEEADDTQASDLPTEKPVATQQAVRIIKTKPEANVYRYQFPYTSRIYVVEFVPMDKTNTKFAAHFYAKGFKDDPKFSNRFGISSYARIEPVFRNVLRAVEQFLEVRRPQQVRFVPGEGARFPSIFHQYIYPALKDFEGDLKKKYIIVRGDSTHDGAAFVLKKGGSQSVLRNKGWKPPTEASHVAHQKDHDAGEPEKKPVHGKEGDVEEQIANVSGAAVATDRPTKSGMGFPGLAAETENEKKRQEAGMKKAVSSMERRKEPK